MSKLPFSFPFCVLFCTSAFATTSQPKLQGVQGSSVIQLTVDASQAGKQIIHVKEDIPVTSGPLILYYPQWIPGEHSPSGPINNLLELHFTGRWQDIPWTRDDVDMYEFHLNVPAGVGAVHATFDDCYDPNSSLNPYMARISWHRDLLYPSGNTSDETEFQASVKLPQGWKYGTPLPVDHEDGQNISFKSTSLTTLVDSPVLAGKNFNRVPLLADPPHEVDIVADTPESAQLSDDTVAKLKNLIAQEYAIFGAHHYNDYHFLLSFSAYGGDMGLEHHECSEDGMGVNGAKDVTYLGYLLCHEFTHSWNGKYRRPIGLATPNYDVPMKGDLLWVYEGLTEYLGTMLAPRSGFWTLDTYREALACIAALMDSQQGRTWRPLVDTARSAHGLGGGAWDAERRNEDYYNESVLIWLDADVQIRRLSGGKKSLEDFLRAFYGAPNTGPMIKPYTYDDLVSTLNQVQPYDWDNFLKQRVYNVQAHAPLGGILASGWALTYTDQPNEQWTQQYGEGSGNTRLALGLTVGGDGRIRDAINGGPADSAGLCPGMAIKTINGKPFSFAAMTDAIKTLQPIAIQVNYDGLTQNYTIQYSGGLKIPHLERDATKPDLLTTIISPHT